MELQDEVASGNSGLGAWPLGANNVVVTFFQVLRLIPKVSRYLKRRKYLPTRFTVAAEVDA